MFIREWYKDEYIITTDKSQMNINNIHEFLTNSYWAKGISIEQIKEEVKNSMCFGLLLDKNQVGFARVITDWVSFGYLCDVYISPDHRNKGLGKWLIATVFSNSEFNKFRRWVLATRDAHTLYHQVGFSSLSKPESFMEKFNKDTFLIGD